MGTKNKPDVHYDVKLDSLAPDEPFFILRAQDLFSNHLVMQWAAMAEMVGVDQRKVEAARDCARAMEKWIHRRIPD